MLWLEDRLRPAAPASWRGDAIGVGLLLVVFAALLWSWADNLGSPSPAQSSETGRPVDAQQIQYLVNVPGQMASAHLLLAVGFALALRCGAIDLSIWIAAGVAGVVAAGLINAGVALTWAFAAACGTGLALGAFNGAMVGLLRLPSVLVTPATGAVVLCVMRWLIEPKAIVVPADSFQALTVLPYPPLLVGRMLIVAGAYSVAMMALVVLDGAVRRGRHFSRRVQLFAALTASGALAGLAGACWLIDRGQTPLPGGVIGDLRPPAAAVLAGALFLAGPGRTLLVGIALPAALLAATIWRQKAWFAPSLSPVWHMVLFVALILVAQHALAKLASRSTKRHTAPSQSDKPDGSPSTTSGLRRDGADSCR